jgi:aspartokinase
MSKNTVTDITVTYNVALVTVDKMPGSLKIVSDIFNAIAKQNINIDMITQTPPYKGNISLSFSVLESDLVKTISTLNRFKRHP